MNLQLGDLSRNLKIVWDCHSSACHTDSTHPRAGPRIQGPIQEDGNHTQRILKFLFLSLFRIHVIYRFPFPLPFQFQLYFSAVCKIWKVWRSTYRERMQSLHCFCSRWSCDRITCVLSQGKSVPLISGLTVGKYLSSYLFPRCCESNVKNGIWKKNLQAFKWYPTPSDYFLWEWRGRLLPLFKPFDF